MNEKEYQSRFAELEALFEEKSARIAYLEEQFRVAQHKQFGKSTKGHPGQGELFDEAEKLFVESETAEETISHTRKKPVRKPLPEDLLRKVIVHDSNYEEKPVAVVWMNQTALVDISQRSFSLSLLRYK